MTHENDKSLISQYEDRLAQLETQLGDRDTIHKRMRWNRTIRWAAVVGVLSVPLIAWTAFVKPVADFTSGSAISSADVNTTIDDIYTALNQVQVEYSGCRTGMSEVGIWCVDDVTGAESNFETAVNTCHAAGKSLCPFEALLACDHSEPATSTCTAYTDGGTDAVPTWTMSHAYADGVSWGTVHVVYGAGNVMTVENGTGPHEYYCCTPRIPLPPPV